MRKLLYAAAAAMLAIASPLTVSAACRVHVHERIVLFGSGDDPGVFLLGFALPAACLPHRLVR